MATQTTHFDLTKQQSNERVSVGLLNDNFDIIDGVMYANQEKSEQLADEYNASETYNTDDYVRRENYLYKCNTDNTTGTWDDTKWDRVKVMDEITQGGGGGSSTLAGLNDVNISNPTDGQVLQYNGTTHEWENKNGGGGGSSTLAGLSDVSVSGVANKDIIRYNSTSQKYEKSSDLTDLELSVSQLSSSVLSIAGDVNTLELTVSQMSASTLPYDANTSTKQKIDNVESSIPTELADLSEDSTHRTVTDTEKDTWNGKVSDNPTFSEAGTRSNIVSGESFATIFGKIKKFFSDLKTVAFTGAYSDLTGQPTIPTVNNGTLTIQKNGTNVATFTANQSGNATANITCENKISRTTTNNWSYYKDSSGVYHISGHISINSCAMTSSLGNGFYRSDVYYWNFPVTLTAVSSIIVTIHDGSGLSGATIHSYTSQRIGLWLWTLNNGTRNITVHIQIVST